jgi:hypothetical protein
MIVAIVTVFVFLIAMLVAVPMIRGINTSVFPSWASTLWALIIPFLFISAIIYLIWMATPERR